MKTIMLYGELGKKFGKVHRMDVRTPAEAIRALSANFKDFEKYMVTAESRGIGFKLRNGNYELEKVDQIAEPASKVIKIIPVTLGGNAESRILIGAVLIAAAIVIDGFSFGAAHPIAQVLGGIGISLVLGGVVEMLSPPPKSNLMDSPEAPNNDPSYSFNGPINTTAQGNPVAVGYGRLLIGSAVISAGISLEQLKLGFTRVKTLKEVIVDFSTKYPGHFWIGQGYTHIPANWINRVYVGSFPATEDPVNPEGTGGAFTIVDRYYYRYYEWTLVPL
jgi:predicted phage tail protein